MILCVPLAKMGRQGYFFSIVMYSTVFIGYAVCRVRKWFIVRKKPENTKFVNAVCTGLFVVVIAVALLPARTKMVQPASDIPTASITETTTLMETDTTAEEAAESITESETETTASDTTESSETTEETSETAETASEETTETEAITEVPKESEAPVEQAVQEPVEQPVIPDPEPVPEPVPEPEPIPEPVYIYRNGTYTASAFGYDGDVEVTVTIENDVILSIYAQSYESDTWYFDSAQGTVISQILATQSTSVDAYSGATYSSNAIMSAVQKALDTARN